MEKKRIYRSNSNKVVAGVCGGIGDYFNIDPVIVRLIWAAVTLFSFGAGVFGYIIAAAVIPVIDDSGKEKRNYGCLYAVLIFLLAAILISVVSSIFGFWGHAFTSGVGHMSNLWRAPYWSGFSGLTVTIFSFIAGLIGIAVLVKQTGRRHTTELERNCQQNKKYPMEAHRIFCSHL